MSFWSFPAIQGGSLTINQPPYVRLDVHLTNFFSFAYFDLDNLTKYYEEKLPDIGSVLKRKVRKTCTRKLLFNTFPVLNWLPKYKRSYAVNDVIAGLTVALTAIPQGIAYGNIAGLPPQYGLYSSFMACFVYIIFGTSKDVTIGK